jgi:hypothetical protein
MAHPFGNFARQTAPAVFASLLGLSSVTTACGSGANEDNAAELTRTQRSPSTNADADGADQNPGSTTNDADEPAEDELDEAGLESEDPPAASSDEPDAPKEASPPAQVFAACLSVGDAYEDCDTIHVTMQEAAAARCVQLTIDNCGAYRRRTLSVEAPSQWDLVSGSIGTSPRACELGVFNISNTVVLDASGTISWNDAAPAPTDLVLELTLEPSRTGGDAASVELATSEPLDVGECPE